MQTQAIINSEYTSSETEPIILNLSLGYRIAKRTIDIIGSFLLLIILSPLFLIIAIIIKIENPSADIFYKQLRSGKNGVPFNFYKFRTMIPNADEVKENLMDLNEMDGPVFKIKNDPRVTRFGRFLRKSSIDELPQLLMVLRGKMSLVGPRPLPVAEAEACNSFQKQRELVKPGITCIWQISGRNDVSFMRWVEMDLEYISKQSLWVDIAILLKTLPAVLFTTGAS